MKIKIGDIVSSIEGVKQLQEINFPVKVSYRLMRLVNKLQTELNSYEEKRIDLIKKYGDAPDEKGAINVTDPEKIALFRKDLQEIFDLEVDIDFEPIKIDDAGDVKIPAKLLVNFIFE